MFLGVGVSLGLLILSSSWLRPGVIGLLPCIEALPGGGGGCGLSGGGSDKLQGLGIAVASCSLNSPCQANVTRHGGLGGLRPHILQTLLAFKRLWGCGLKYFT